MTQSPQTLWAADERADVGQRVAWPVAVAGRRDHRALLKVVEVEVDEQPRLDLMEAGSVAPAQAVEQRPHGLPISCRSKRARFSCVICAMPGSLPARFCSTNSSTESRALRVSSTGRCFNPILRTRLMDWKKSSPDQVLSK